MSAESKICPITNKPCLAHCIPQDKYCELDDLSSRLAEKISSEISEKAKESIQFRFSIDNKPEFIKLAIENIISKIKI
jgi:hypothetical protein